MSMTPDEMIAVIQAYKEGQHIERRYKFTEGEAWVPGAPTWDFMRFDYRPMAEPREWWFAVHKNLQRHDGSIPICGAVYPNKPHSCTADEVIHVREVLS